MSGPASEAPDVGRSAVVTAGSHAGALAGSAPPSPVTIVAHDVAPLGGMERQLTELVLGMRRLGHEVVVVACRCELPDDPGVRVHRIRAPRRPFLLSYLWVLLAGSLVVRRHRRGIVHTAGAIVLNRVDVIAVHCCHQVYSAGPAPGRGPARWYREVLAFVKRKTERHCFTRNSAATLVCVSNGVAEEVRTHFPEAVERVVAIHNGVDLERFTPGGHSAQAAALRRSLSLAPGDLTVAFVGGNWADKGLAALIEALASAPGWHLVVAGKGRREEYETLAGTLGVASRVHWLGVRRDVETVYEMADAFALPSRYETFSLVTFEAAATGVPVLASPVSGVNELIEDGVSGYLVAADSLAISARLRSLAADPELRRRMGAAARSATLAFGWERMVSRHEALYAQIAAAAQVDSAGYPPRADRGAGEVDDWDGSPSNE